MALTLINHPEITHKTNTIIKWVRSCRTQEQIDLAKQLYRPLIYDLYRGKADPSTLLFSHMEINTAITQQEKLVTTQKNTPHHEQSITAIC